MTSKKKLKTVASPADPSNSNKILKLKENDFYEDENVLIQKVVSGEVVEIWKSDNTWGHSKLKNKKYQPYLEISVIPKLESIVSKYFNLDLHFYGIVSAGEFRGYDIYVNGNYFDLERVDLDYKESGLKALETVYSGAFSKFSYSTLNKKSKRYFLIRTKFEQPSKRLIKYFI